jgi:hypothetical protein
MNEAVLQRVADRQEITDLIYRFCKLVDAGGDELSRIGPEIFTEDGIDDHSDGAIPKTVQHGRQEINTFYARRRGQAPGVRMHCATNIMIDLDGDTARASWYAIAWHWSGTAPGTRPERPANVVALEPVESELRRTPAGWRVSRQAIHFRGVGVGAISNPAGVDNGAGSH